MPNNCSIFFFVRWWDFLSNTPLLWRFVACPMSSSLLMRSSCVSGCCWWSKHWREPLCNNTLYYIRILSKLRRTKYIRQKGLSLSLYAMYIRLQRYDDDDGNLTPVNGKSLPATPAPLSVAHPSTSASLPWLQQNKHAAKVCLGGWGNRILASPRALVCSLASCTKTHQHNMPMSGNHLCAMAS